MWRLCWNYIKMIDVKLVFSMEFSRLIFTLSHFCFMQNSPCKSNSLWRQFTAFLIKFQPWKESQPFSSNGPAIWEQFGSVYIGCYSNKLPLSWVLKPLLSQLALDMGINWMRCLLLKSSMRTSLHVTFAGLLSLCLLLVLMESYCFWKPLLSFIFEKKNL